MKHQKLLMGLLAYCYLHFWGQPLLAQIQLPTTPMGDETQGQLWLFPPQTTLQQVFLEDATVISQKQVNEIAEPYRGKNLTFEEVLEIQRQLTNLYVQQGYVTSTVQFSGWDNERLEAGEGVIVFRAIEGRLEDLQIEGLTHLQESYVRSRLLPYTAAPLNLNELESGLLLLRDNPLIRQVQANLVPGSQPGQSIWLVRLDEAPTWRIGAEGSNEENPVVGDWGWRVQIENRNLVGGGEAGLQADRRLRAVSRNRCRSR